MNVSFTTQQRHTAAQGLLILATAIALVTLAAATGSMPSGFTVQAETLMAFAQGALGA
jgi:hypothetical protein